MQVWMALVSIVLTVHVDYVCCVVRFTTEPTVIPAAGEPRFTVGRNHYEGQQQQKENQFDGVTIFWTLHARNEGKEKRGKAESIVGCYIRLGSRIMVLYTHGQWLQVVPLCIDYLMICRFYLYSLNVVTRQSPGCVQYVINITLHVRTREGTSRWCMSES